MQTVWLTPGESIIESMDKARAIYLISKAIFGSQKCACRLIRLWLLLSLTPSAHGVQTFGRLTLGTYLSTEKYKDDASGSQNNDFMTASGRAYLAVSEIGENKNWDFISDLRDKNDFFGKLNRELYQLDNANTFQVRQFEMKYESPNRNYFGDIGRFPVADAGHVLCDGGLYGFKNQIGFSAAGFAGLNAKRNDQSYATYNPDSVVKGAYIKYQSQAYDWSKNFSSSLAYVSETVKSEEDRRYLFNNFIYQWSPMSRLFYLIYLDFVPRTYVQTGYLGWNQELTQTLTTDLQYIAVDAVGYTRRQGFRETLEPSAYREGSVKIKNNFTANFNSYLMYVYGQRQIDDLNKREYILSLGFPQFFSPQFDFGFKAGYRHNFTSEDIYARISTGFFTRFIELVLDLESGVERPITGGALHPFTAELSLGLVVSKKLFVALSVEETQDERVTIWSTFLKMSYRFGSIESAPIRDGTSPRGRL